MPFHRLSRPKMARASQNYRLAFLSPCESQAKTTPKKFHSRITRIRNGTTRKWTMQHDSNSSYFDACQYAVDALGADTAPQYFPRLKQLSRYAPLEDLYALVDSWRP